MPNQQLKLVKDQALKQQDTLSEKFQLAVNYVQKERDQLAQLQQYEADYVDKIKQQQTRWNSQNVGRYREFCHQLTKAIIEQKNKLAHAEQRLEIMRGELCQHQQKLNVLDDVIARAEAESSHLHNRIMQKEMDEFSSRRRHSHF